MKKERKTRSSHQIRQNDLPEAVFKVQLNLYHAVLTMRGENQLFGPKLQTPSTWRPFFCLHRVLPTNSSMNPFSVISFIYLMLSPSCAMSMLHTGNFGTQEIYNHHHQFLSPQQPSACPYLRQRCLC